MPRSVSGICLCHAVALYEPRRARRLRLLATDSVAVQVVLIRPDNPDRSGVDRAVASLLNSRRPLRRGPTARTTGGIRPRASLVRDVPPVARAVAVAGVLGALQLPVVAQAPEAVVAG
jgi:hypothetical protein